MYLTFIMPDDPSPRPSPAPDPPAVQIPEPTQSATLANPSVSVSNKADLGTVALAQTGFDVRLAVMAAVTLLAAGTLMLAARRLSARAGRP